ncbi:MAG: hypothetical protein HY777_04735, partial [Betaproteobacteria bacterium]|nr:hypothetical protein [Betaproteobacteria bacterium]
MATTQLADIIIPENFTSYTVQNSVERNAFFLSGVAVPNSAITGQLQAGADSFKVPYWLDLPDTEADVANDDPTDESTPGKLGTIKQVVRKSFLHGSWSAMNLASELAGANALAQIQSRAAAYWDRQFQRRLISSLKGILADNVAHDSGNLLIDVSGLTGNAAKFSASSMIEAAGTMGDAMNSLTTIAIHSTIYKKMLADDVIETLPASGGGFIQTFRGLRIVVDDTLPVATDVYTSVLFGSGAVGYLSPTRWRDGRAWTACRPYQPAACIESR